MPKLGEEMSSTVDLGYPAPAGSQEETTEVLEGTGREKTKLVGMLKHSTEATEKTDEVPKLGESTGLQKILSPPLEPELSKVPRAPVITPKRRRMASVLDVVLESIRVSALAPGKETAEATTVRVEAEAGPSVPIKTEPVGTR